MSKSPGALEPGPPAVFCLKTRTYLGLSLFGLELGNLDISLGTRSERDVNEKGTF